MKKLLFILCVLFSLGASAQTMVYDTTVVKAPLGVVIGAGGIKDSLYMPAATTIVNGYMTAAAMTQLAALVGGSTTYPATNVRSTTTYTLQTSDYNKMINMSNISVSTITIPTGLPDGWTCSIIQTGSSTSTVTIAGVGGVTIRSPFNYRRSQTQYGVIKIVCLGSNVYSLSGNLKQ
jgi:hypothetical protein